ncbi:MAG: amidohydrolase family protein [Parvibaculaceae bacterium]
MGRKASDKRATNGTDHDGQDGYDLIVRDVRIFRQAGGRQDIGIRKDRIEAVGRSLAARGKVEIDGKGALACPGLVDAHVHLDKGMLTDRCNERIQTLDEMIHIMRRLKKECTVDDVHSRMRRGALEGLARGTVAMRTNVEADPFFEMKAVDASLRLRDDLKGLMELQTIAFPQDGWFSTDGTLEAGCEPFVEEAIGRGIDLVGGNVNRGLWPSDPDAQVDRIFEIAKKYDRGVDAHVDNSDNAATFSLPYVAKKTLEHGYEGRVTVGHVASLRLVPPHLADQTIRLAAQARLHVGVQPTRIEVAPVRKLLDAGVNVFVGSDEVMGIYTRTGVGDQVMTMWLLSLVTHLCTDEDYDEIMTMATYNAARAMNLKDYGVARGCVADLVLFDGTSAAEVICYQRGRRAVIKGGRLVARDGELLPEVRRQMGISG